MRSASRALSPVAGLVIALATLLLGLGFAERAAAGAWSKPVELVSPRAPQSTGAIQLGAGPGWYAVAAFNRGSNDFDVVDLKASALRRVPNGSILARTRDNVGRWGKTAVVSKGTKHNGRPHLGVGEDGATVLAWLDRNSRIVAATRSSASGWSSPQVLTPVLSAPGLPTIKLDLDVAADGSAAIAWTVLHVDGTKSLGAVLRSGTGEWGEPVTLLEDLDTPFIPAVAAAAGGQAAIAQAPVCPFSGPVGLASVLVFDGASWSAEAEVPGSECANDSAYAIGANLSAGGGLAMLFSGGPADGTRSVRLAVWPSILEPKAAKRISKGGVRSGFARLGADTSGRIVSTWSAGNGGNPRGIFAYVGNADEPLGPLRRINRKPARGTAQLAVSDTGWGIAAWQSRRAPFRLRAAVLKPGWRRFTRDRKVSHRLAADYLNRPAIAAGPDGHLYVGWIRTTKRGKSRGIYVSQRQVK